MRGDIAAVDVFVMGLYMQSYQLPFRNLAALLSIAHWEEGEDGVCVSDAELRVAINNGVDWGNMTPEQAEALAAGLAEAEEDDYDGQPERPEQLV